MSITNHFRANYMKLATHIKGGKKSIFNESIYVEKFLENIDLNRKMKIYEEKLVFG